jgi:REP element-mobilizing transposase RayT
MTCSVIEGIPLFKEPAVVNFILEGFVFLQQKRSVELNAFVIMENHIHFIVKGEDLSEHIRNFKSFSAHRIINYLKENKKARTLRKLKIAKLDHKIESDFQVWAEGSHPQQLSTYKMVSQKIDYIHFNPLKRGYVENPEHWRYSSAKNYRGLDGLIPVTVFGG